MATANTTAYLTDPIYEKHETGAGHPERPERLAALNDMLSKSSVADRLSYPTIRHYPFDWCREVHVQEHVQAVQRAAEHAPTPIGMDTHVSEHSLEAAHKAFSAVMMTADHIMDGKIRNAFCAVRPPGHHAESNAIMGFCLFNNIAIAARYLQHHHNLERILIVDWDVHHGNGTQEIFYNDPSVLYVSTHQSPLFPGTGSRQETGQGAGEGCTLNIPLAAGSGDKELTTSLREDFIPKAQAFQPSFVLLSAGFDAHQRDPLAGLEMTEEGFREATRIVKEVADELCDGQMISVLEGGYDLTGLAASVEAHLEELTS